MSNQPNSGRGYGQSYGQGYGDGYGDDQTRVFNNQAGYNQSYDQGYDRQYEQAHNDYGSGYETSYRHGESGKAKWWRRFWLVGGSIRWQARSYQSDRPCSVGGGSYLRGRFVVDLLVGMLPNQYSSGASAAGLAAVVAGAIGVLAGLLYIPVSGTGNERLFGMAVVL